MIKLNLNSELSIEEYVDYLQKGLEEQKEIFEISELANDLSGMALSFNRISEIEHLLSRVKERLNMINGVSYRTKIGTEVYSEEQLEKYNSLFDKINDLEYTGHLR